MMKSTRPIVALLACVCLLEARQQERSCGTYTDNWREELQLHQRSQALLPRLKLSAGKQAVRLLPDIGNLAHLEDTDGVVARRNPFDLNGLTIRFVPGQGAKTYRLERAGEPYSPSAASEASAVANLEDDDSQEFAFPFAFPFFGTEYRSYYLNSDGNITFGEGDSTITDRSLGRMLSGPPRIAAQFNDLDPSRTGAAVKVRNEANAVVISWDSVPEFSEVGRGPVQVFQMRLFATGVIEFAYRSGSPTEAVVGIAPGRLNGDPALVEFSTTPASEYTSSIVERFSSTSSVDIFAAAQKFYRNHEDAYDYLAIYNTLDIGASAGAVAYEVTLRNNRSGYGDQKADAGNQAGSKKRLQAILNMGPLSQYPRDPNGRVQARSSVGDTPVTTLAHEMGHLFLAYVSVEDELGNRPLLGYQDAHWDFKFNSDASLMEGNRIQDNGAGASPRFLTTATVEGFSALDQYLMGFKPLTEVPDTFYVKNTRGAVTTGTPRVGVAFDGERVNVSLAEIIDGAGRRTPDHTVSQRQFRVAFLIVTPEGQTPTAEQIAQVEGYRTTLETFFQKATSQNATADTAIRKAVSLSAFPAVGLVTGGSATVNVSIEQPAASALQLELRSRSGRVRVPASITIPAGATQASATLGGLSEGTDDIAVQPLDRSYDGVTAKVQVRPASELSLKVLSEASPIRFQVTDVNNLPYPGVTVQAAASAGGSLDRPSVTTGTDGVAEFQWTQSAQTANSVTARVVGGPSVTVNASAAPIFATANVVNAASYAPGLVAGGIASIFGANLGGRNAEIMVNDRQAQVLFANGEQVNFVVPSQAPEGVANIVVRAGNATSAAVRVPVLPVQPGLFFDAGSNQGAITIAGSALLTFDNPPAPGDYISIYATGLGLVRSTTAGLQETVVPPEVSIGGAAADVVFSGLAPGYVGLYQINVQVPKQSTPGTSEVIVTSAGVRSNSVRIAIR